MNDNIKQLVQKYENELVPNIDPLGLIVQSDKDGGDTAQRVACWAYTCYALGQPERGLPYLQNYLQQCQPEPGRFMRHVKPPHNNINNFTRDQSEILQLCLHVYGFKDTLKSLLKQRLKRCMFHFNTQDEQVSSKLPDPPSLTELASWLRMTKTWLVYLALCIKDIELLAGVIIVSRSERASWDSDAKLIPQLHFANNNMKTPFAMLAMKLYAKQGEQVKARLYKYFGVPPSTYNGVPALGKLLYVLYKKMTGLA